MIALTHKRATVNGVTLHYVTVGKGPVVLCMHGWPQNHREFLPGDKPYDGYDPKTIAEDMLALLAAERVEKFLRYSDRRLSQRGCHRGMRPLGLRREDRFHSSTARQFLGEQ
jgi:hypothetical protein